MEILQINMDGDSNVRLLRARHARTFGARLKGLLGERSLPPGEALLITPCSQVHTVGMRFPLDVVLLDHFGVVLKCVANLKPGRLAGARNARHVLELSAGSIERFKIERGQRMRWTSQGDGAPPRDAAVQQQGERV